MSDQSSAPDRISLPRCVKCGYPIELFTGTGPIVITSDTHAEALTMLLTGKVDEYPCGSCGTKLPLWPTIAVRFGDGDVVEVVRGSQLDDQRAFEEFLESLQQSLTSRSVEICQRASIPELRQAVFKRLQPTISKVADLFLAGNDASLAEHVERSWEVLTPNVFAVGALAASGTIPWLTVGNAAVVVGSQGDTRDAAMDILARAQTLVWAHLAMKWSVVQDEYDRRLEQDLGRYVSLDTPPRAAAVALDKLIGLMSTELTALDSYIIEVIRAYVYWAAKLPNPRADEWADLFFWFEHQAGMTKEGPHTIAWALSISDGLACNTVTGSSAWNAIVRRLPIRDDESLRSMRITCARIGQEDLLEKVLLYSFRTDTSAETLCSLYHDQVEAGPEALLGALLFASVLEKRNDVPGFERLLAEVEAKYLDGSDERRSELDVWAGEIFKNMRAPEAFLNRVGDQTKEWEHRLAVELRAALWTERSNALRLADRFTDALSIAEEILSMLPAEASDLRYVATHNVAILRRDTGRPDEALRMLEELLKTATSSQRPAILESLSTTLMMLGQGVAALKHVDEMADLARERADFRSSAWATTNRVQILVKLDRLAEAVRALEDIDLDRVGDPKLALIVAACWIRLLSRSPTQVPADLPGRLLTNLDQVASEAIQRGDALELEALDLTAALHDTLGDPNAAEKWAEARETRHRQTGRTTAAEEASLAFYAYHSGDVRRGREHLATLAATMADLTGGATDLFTSAMVVEPVRGPLRGILNGIMSSPAPVPEDARLVAELYRDAVGRAVALRTAAEHESVLLDKEILADIGCVMGDVAVVEWTGFADLPRALITRISYQGEIVTRWLDPMPAADIDNLVQLIDTRLREWRLDLPGDPLDVDSWRQWTAWLISSLAEHVPADTHIVIIEHERLRGLPWHVAIGHQWETSYASSWWALTEITRASARPIPQALGLLHAPRYHEPEEVSVPLSIAAQAIIDLAGVQGMRLEVAQRESADRKGLDRVFANADLALILCHGYVDPGGDVGLILSDRGVAAPLARGLPALRGHLISAQEIQLLPRTPGVVIIGACSSGKVRYAGLGESLGMYSSLRSKGTRTLIAARWDIVAKEVLPIISELVGAIACGAATGSALRDTCRSAERNMPNWLAWSLALEGDWR